GAQIQTRVREILEEMLEPKVALPGLVEVSLTVEVDVAEHAFQLGFVRVFDFLQGDVNPLADVRLSAHRVQVLEVALFRQYEPLTYHCSLDALFISGISLGVFVQLFRAKIGEVLYEQHYEDVILVLRRVDRSAECVTRTPY